MTLGRGQKKKAKLILLFALMGSRVLARDTFDVTVYFRGKTDTSGSGSQP